MGNDWIEKTKAFESFSAKPYIDTRGNETTGYGFNLNAYPNLSRNMTKAQADQYFIPIYQQAQKRAQSYAGPVWDSLSPNQQGILTDMSYNLGNRLYGFTGMQQALQNYDVNGVKREMVDSNWYRQTGRRAKSHVQNWDWQPVQNGNR